MHTLSNINFLHFRLFMMKKRIFLCHLRLAQTHGHRCLEHFQFHSEVVVGETVSPVDLPVMDATVMVIVTPVDLPVMEAVMVITIMVITIDEVTTEVSMKAHFLAMLELALEASWELLEENKCINFGIFVTKTNKL